MWCKILTVTAIPDARAVPIFLQSKLRLTEALLPLVPLARRLICGALLRLDELDGRGLRGVFHDDGLGRRGALPLGLLTTCGGGAALFVVGFPPSRSKRSDTPVWLGCRLVLFLCSE